MSQNTIPNDDGTGEIPVEEEPQATPRRKRRGMKKVSKKVVKKVSHRGWPKGKKRGPRKPKVPITPVPEYIASSSGAKQVGVEVCLSTGRRFHAPLGSAWRWSVFNGMAMLEVLDPASTVCAQFPAGLVESVCANIWTKPLWS